MVLYCSIGITLKITDTNCQNSFYHDLKLHNTFFYKSLYIYIYIYRYIYIYIWQYNLGGRSKVITLVRNDFISHLRSYFALSTYMIIIEHSFINKSYTAKINSAPL